MYAIGVNPWVWASPVDDEALAELVPRIAAFGFDAVELPMEQPGDWDPVRPGDLLARTASSRPASARSPRRGATWWTPRRRSWSRRWHI